jgi:hypothetical protein
MRDKDGLQFRCELHKASWYLIWEPDSSFNGNARLREEGERSKTLGRISGAVQNFGTEKVSGYNNSLAGSQREGATDEVKGSSWVF